MVCDSIFVSWHVWMMVNKLMAPLVSSLNESCIFIFNNLKKINFHPVFIS